MSHAPTDFSESAATEAALGGELLQRIDPIQLAEAVLATVRPGGIARMAGRLTAGMTAVLLGRSLEPRKVEAAREALRDAGMLDPEALAEADPTEIVDAIRFSGAKLTPKGLAPLKKIARWLADRGVETLADAPAEAIRDGLSGNLCRCTGYQGIIKAVRMAADARSAT